MLVFSVLFWGVLYAIQRLQGHLFLNPDHMKGVPAHLSLNTAASFITNTNWQFYGGEYTMSYLTQMAGLAVQNFVSAAVGIAVLAAVIRGLARRNAETIGNFWVDLYRTLVYILLPLSILVAAILIWQGVPQTLQGHAVATTLQGVHQSIARGPVASQVAIKQLGTNGGGFYNSNSAVPFENPTGLSNFVEMLAILLIPAGQVFMFGKMVLARRHAWAVFAAMFVDLAIGVGVNLRAEQHGSSVLRNSGVNITRGAASRAAIWPTRRFGSDRPTPRSGRSRRATVERLGERRLRRDDPGRGGPSLVNIFAGEVIFGGVGSGLYGMIFYILIAVFIAGLMVGRTPEYLGEEDRGARDQIRRARCALRADAGAHPGRDRGRHEEQPRGDLRPWRPRLHRDALRLDSEGVQQRQRLRRLHGLTNFRADVGGVAMLLGRYVPIVAALAIGGSLAAKKSAPSRPAPSGPTAPRSRAARRRDRAHRRPDDPAGAVPRPDRGRTDALMRKHHRQSEGCAGRDRRPDGGLRTRLSRAMTGFAQATFKNKANGSLITLERQGRRLEARSTGVHEREVLPRAPVGRRVQRGGDELRKPRPDGPRARDDGPQQPRRRS